MLLFWISIFFIIGIVTSSLSNLSTASYFCLLIIPVLVYNFPSIIIVLDKKIPSFKKLKLSWKKHKLILRLIDFNKHKGINIISMLSLFLIFMIFGAARLQVAKTIISEGDIALYNDGAGYAKIVGVIYKVPEKRGSYINLWVDVESIQIDDNLRPIEVKGKIIARVAIDVDLHYGDKVYLTGELLEPQESEDFSYKDYLARQKIFSIMPYANVFLLSEGNGNSILYEIFEFKENAKKLVYQFFPDPEASLMAGILLGIESGISSDIKQSFQDTGTSHIIAISGFNITIVAGLFSVVFSRSLGKRRGAFAALFGIVIYTILVGADAAVVRAAIMGGLSLFARQVGRRQDGLNSLAFTAAIMCLVNPYLLWDVGFQLSFMATLGLVLYAGPFKEKFEIFIGRWATQKTIDRVSGPIAEYFLFTIAAQIAILPILAYHFQRVSLSSIPANIAILPAQAFIMILGGLSILLGSIFFPIGQIVAYTAWPFVAYTIRVVEWFSQFKGGVIILAQVGIIFVISYYVVMFSITFWGKEIRKKISEINPSISFLILGLITVLLWQAVLNLPDGKLHVTMMDVGTGDAVLIQSPTGRFILINGGPSANQLSSQIGRWLPLFNRKLDFLIISSTQENQISGLPDSIERFIPAEVIWAGEPSASRSGRYLKEKLTDLQIPILPAINDQILNLGEGIELEFISVGSRGAVLLLSWNDFRMLMPLGMSFENMENLDEGRDIGSVSALILADNGYAPLNPKIWVNNLHPQVILLSVQAGDYDGLPSLETLEAIEEYTLLRTDQNGWINIETDGAEMWIEADNN